jgi:hypothetical protein
MPNRSLSGRTTRHPAAPAAAAPWRAAPLGSLLLALTLALLVAVQARAQDLDVSQVLRAVEERVSTIVDVEFVLAGVIIDEAGQRLQVEVEVMAIPAIPAVSLYIVQPDALPDNQVIIEGDVLRNYTFLTNQVSVFRADDPNALGGLLPEAAGATVDLDLGRVFEGWNARIDAFEGGAYVVRFDNRELGALIHHVLATIDATTWLPARLVFYRSDEDVFADLRFTEMSLDQGLLVEDVTYLPEDAEIIDRRR